MISGGVAVSAFADLLRRAISAADVACLRIAGNDGTRVATIAKELMEPAQAAGVAVLLDDPELAGNLGADGVHLEDPARYAEVRRRLGSDFIVGVACPLERHIAMEVGEADADYVQFTCANENLDDALDLIGWWSEVMTVPSVIASPPDRDIAARIITAGADFLAPDTTLWNLPDPVAIVAGLIA